MSNVYLSDCRPPLFMDFGTDVVKYCQNFPNYGTNDSQSDKSSINNTAYVETLPTIVGKTYLDDKEPEFFKKICEDYRQGKFRESDLKLEDKTKSLINHENYLENLFKPFDGETMWGGKIINESYWKKILEIIGEMTCNKYNFLESRFSEVPLVFTQHSLQFNELKYQNPQIFETAFEEMQAPFVLICSQAMLNLFSYNHTSGIVVDLGESGTQITPVLQGYTDYNNSIHSDIMSARNVSMLLADHYRVVEKQKESLNISNYDEFFQAKYLKESLDFTFDKNNTNKAHCLSYLYSYPQVFKYLFKDSTSASFATSLDDLWNFVYQDKLFLKPNHKFNSSKSEKDFLNNILQSNNQSIEKKILTTGNEIFNLGFLGNFQKLSTIHMAIWTIERLITENLHSFEDKPRLFFAGGMMNSKGLKEIFQKEFEQILGYAIETNPVEICFSQSNYQTLFAKGAQTVSNLDKLGQLMISKQDYHENGKDNLAFNYI
jgi:actin-related protein